jgi:hypothetical protein
VVEVVRGGAAPAAVVVVAAAATSAVAAIVAAAAAATAIAPIEVLVDSSMASVTMSMVHIHHALRRACCYVS